MQCNKLINRAVVFACLFGMAFCASVSIALTTQDLVTMLLSVGGCGLSIMLTVNELWFVVDIMRIRDGALRSGLPEDKVL